MRLIDLLERMEYRVLQGDTDKEVSTLVYDSRKVEKDSVFFTGKIPRCRTDFYH